MLFHVVVWKYKVAIKNKNVLFSWHDMLIRLHGFIQNFIYACGCSLAFQWHILHVARTHSIEIATKIVQSIHFHMQHAKCEFIGMRNAWLYVNLLYDDTLMKYRKIISETSTLL